MNHFQNNNTRKFLFPPQTASDYSDIQGNFELGKKQKKEDQPRNKSIKTRKSGALNIFFESDSISQKEHRFQWSLKKKTQACRLAKDFSDDKGKVRKEKKRNRKPINSPNIKSKEPAWPILLLNSFNPSIAQNEAKAKLRSELPKFLSKTEANQNNDTAEKQGKGSGLEKAPVNSLFTIRKENRETEKKTVKMDINAGPVDTTNSGELRNLGSLQKVSKKPSIKCETPEIKITASENRKLHINEILKGHAQKTQNVQAIPSKSNHQIKDYSFLGVSDLLQRAKNIGSANAATANKKEEKPQKDDITTKKEKPKEPELAEREAEEKKKLASSWIKLPQSNELERRLKGSPQESELLFPQNKPEPPAEDNDKTKKIEDKKVNEDEKKEEKKPTYTDRVFARVNNKEKDEKTEKEGEDVTSLKKPTGGSAGNVNKKNESLLNIKSSDGKTAMVGPIREITLSVNQDITTIKDIRLNEGEHMLKTKATRSTELRDLVTQAVKEHKIFCIFDNHWYIVRPVREELLSRGWLEVIPDRRLIPRRRPPPMGPTYDREKTAVDHTIEAILTAKENFADEIHEKVSKSSSFRISIEKLKSLPSPAVTITKKSSEESLNEVLSQFRIIPPTTEKKKNNFEIREFVTKYMTAPEKEKEKEKDKKVKDYSKNTKNNNKKDKIKTTENSEKETKMETDNVSSIADTSADSPTLSKSLQAILDTINDNKKAIAQATSELKNIEARIQGRDALGALLSSSEKASEALACLPSANKDVQEKTVIKPPDCGSKFGFSENEAKTISKIIQSTNARIHFMWLSIKPSIHLKCFNYSPEIINKFQKTTFCTKIGLWSHLSNIQWYAHEVHYPAKSPRMYNTGEPDDLQAFFQDFQLTACIGMLKWLADTFFDRGMKAVQTKKGKVPLKAFEFAIKQCERYMRFKDNEDLGIAEEQKVLQEEWNTFLQWFYIITNDHGKVQESSSAQLMVVYTKAVETLRTMKKFWPEIDIDGRLNIWIMKPYCASCGRGIFMTNNVYYIGQHSKYIVQKYIEKPLLIYNTKFDIRQWFMITKLTPLEIWMYKECYLRFCTQPFALRNLHESVHLSNNSVQRKYVSYRDPSLPDQNMWDSNTFQLYLKTIGHPNAWEDIIYPGMRDAIVSTMLASQDTFDGPRRSWFEVYGADFMLSSNVKDGPWLIEINENPAMDPSTKVTARLCPQMLRDVIKVVVDKRNNKNASTGQWELIYRQNYSPSFGTVDLDVKGKKIARVPPTLKLTLNLQSHPSTTPTSKQRNNDDADGNKLYEVVKSFGTGQIHKGDVGDSMSKIKKSKEKLTKVIKPMEKDLNLKQLEQLAAKINKDKSIKATASEESKNVKETINKKEEVQKSVGTVVQLARVQTQSEEPKKNTKVTKENKNSLPPVSSTARLRLKRIRVGSLSRDEPKRTNLGADTTDKKIISDSKFSGHENKKVASGQDQKSNHQSEKFKFTKFYKV